MRPQEGGLRQSENFWLRLLQPAHSVCISLSAFFITHVNGLNTIVTYTAINKNDILKYPEAQKCTLYVLFSNDDDDVTEQKSTSWLQLSKNSPSIAIPLPKV